VLLSLKRLVSTLQLDPDSANSTMEQSAFSTPNNRAADGDIALELSEGEVMRIELYEENPKLDRQVVVREKVQLKKVLTEGADSQP
jgi:stress response protein YsnF